MLAERVVMPALLTDPVDAGIDCDTILVRGGWPKLVRINCTGCVPVIQVAPDGITVPAGDGVRGGMLPRTKFVDIFVTVLTVGGVWARIAPRGAFMLVTVVTPLAYAVAAAARSDTHRAMARRVERTIGETEIG